MVDPLSEQHHLVSKGYQRNFADTQHRVAIIDPRTGELLDGGRPIKSNFVAAGYNTHVTHDGTPVAALEVEWAKIEQPVLDQIRRVGPQTLTPERRGAVMSLAAMHLVRNPAYQSFHQQIASQVEQEQVPVLAADRLDHADS